MSFVSQRIARSGGRYGRSRPARRAMRGPLIALLLAVACAGCFAIGRAGRAAEPGGAPPWSPVQALPASTIAADGGAPASIPDLRFAAAPKPAVRRGHALAASGGTPHATATSAAGTGGSSSVAVQTEATVAPTQAAPASQGQAAPPATAPTSSGAKSAAPASSGKAGQGSSSGSFDSSE